MTQIKKGFIPVMLTPFTNSGAVDYDMLTILTEKYLKAGAAGLFANCLSSEMFELTGEERLKVTKHVVDVVNGAVPVVATGTFGGPIPEQAAFVNEIAQTGIDAVIVIASLIAGEIESDEVFNERVFELFKLTGNVPLGFYECPVPYKRLLSPAQIKLFADSGKVIYHKDTCLDINQVSAKIEAGKGNSKFGLYDAYMAHAVQSLKAGSAGLSCIQGNYFPELIVWLCDHYADETLKAQVDLAQQFLIDQMDVMHNVYPITAKCFLNKRGLPISQFTRRDVGVFTPTISAQIDELLENYKKLQSELGIVSVF